MKYLNANIIGRFQLPHKAHFELIETALSLAENVTIGIGSSNIRSSLRNPFSFGERVMLIEHCGLRSIEDAIADERIQFVPLEDSPYNETWWVEHVQRQFKKKNLGSIATNTTAIVGCNRDDTTYYLDMFPQWVYEHHEQTRSYSATDCRQAYYEYDLDDKRFINQLHDFTTPGVVNALRFIPSTTSVALKKRYQFVKDYHAQWGPGPHYTADPVVIKSGHVLLVKRGAEPDIGSWAFPGGFQNPNEQAWEACIRECKEETGLDLDNVPRSKYKLYDRPFRDDRGDIRTSANLFNLGNGTLPEVQGMDDAAHAEWVPLADLSAMKMFSDHYFILKDLLKYV